MDEPLRDPEHDELGMDGWIYVPDLPGYINEPLGAAFFVQSNGREYWKLNGGNPQCSGTLGPEMWVSEGL